MKINKSEQHKNSINLDFFHCKCQHFALNLQRDFPVQPKFGPVSFGILAQGKCRWCSKEVSIIIRLARTVVEEKRVHRKFRNAIFAFPPSGSATQWNEHNRRRIVAFDLKTQFCYLPTDWMHPTPSCLSLPQCPKISKGKTLSENHWL